MNKQNSLSISTGGFENFLGLLEQGYIGSDVLKGTTTQVDSLRSRGVTLDDIDVKILFENLSPKLFLTIVSFEPSIISFKSLANLAISANSGIYDPQLIFKYNFVRFL